MTSETIEIDPESLGCYFCRKGQHERCVRLPKSETVPDGCFCRAMNHLVKCDENATRIERDG